MSVSAGSDAREALVRAAAGYPEATEDFPWDERVAKVNKKVFAFLGLDDGDEPAVSLKLPESAEFALSQPGVQPTGHGLGRSGWVTVRLDEASPDLDLLLEWLDESYRTVAPARLVTLLDQRSPDQ